MFSIKFKNFTLTPVLMICISVGALLLSAQEVSVTKYYYLNGPVAKKDNNGNNYLHKDHLGSVRVITDEDQQIVGSMDYFPFGSELRASGDIASKQFTGHEKDEETGLSYAKARFLDHETGRFTSRDPIDAKIDNPQRWNKYVYCANNPLKFVDPDGEEQVYLSEGNPSSQDQNQQIKFRKPEIMLEVKWGQKINVGEIAQNLRRTPSKKSLLFVPDKRKVKIKDENIDIADILDFI